MKVLLSLPIMALYAGCVNTTGPLVRNDIRIVPPVTQEGYNSTTGVEKIAVFNDGGTQLFKIIDAEGKHFDIYIDHGIGSLMPGAIYLRAYPGKPGSVRVLNQREFERKIGVFK